MTKRKWPDIWKVTVSSAWKIWLKERQGSTGIETELLCLVLALLYVTAGVSIIISEYYSS